MWSRWVATWATADEEVILMVNIGLKELRDLRKNLSILKILH